LIRPALCVQAREGRLHIFLPYASKLADYLDLLAAVEDTCQYLGMPVWLEGYPPPSDPRLISFSVTPDPGVLEVNLPPASTWDELVQFNRVLFEEARRNRLAAEKFAYDGSHIATGGGSHIVIGGATILDSPFLRRPDLLRSMLCFWQNHPSLSYLFSGMYVGPTSQSPRVDEARTEALYELEVAFSNLPVNDCSPHLLDGLFRHLLVDVTGNSHRAEFCIDKLYPPVGSGLRLGLLELRAFEMAPHVRMGLVAMLLIRFGSVHSKANSSAGTPRYMTASCCLTLSNATFMMCLPTCAIPATVSKTSGSRRTMSFAFRRSEPSLSQESNSNSATPSNLGTCWPRRQVLAVPPAPSIPPSSAFS
jgi:uncharacterized protein (DUF2126 family)